MEEYGALSVTHSGTTVKLKLYVDNKDICPLVNSMTDQGIQQYSPLTMALCSIY